MKKNLSLSLLISTFFITAFPVTGQAQSASEELAMREFARNFMAAYNRQDVDALKAMYTTDAVSMVEGSEAEVGADRIAYFFAERFTRDEATLLVKQTGVAWSDAQQAFVARGTYEGYGATYVYDIPYSNTTAYANTMVRENGQWKIAKSVVTPIVKTMVQQKVGDFPKWKWALKGLLDMYVGVLGYEIGTLHNDPGTAYAIIQWPSIEVAQAFFANPDLEKAMQEVGVTKKPTILFLDSK